MLDIYQVKFTWMDNFAKHMCPYLVWNLNENYFHLLDDIYLLKFYIYLSTSMFVGWESYLP